MNRIFLMGAAVAGLLLSGCGKIKDEPKLEASASPDGFVGSKSCRDCHERFYELWAPSHHGKALQPYNDGLGATLTPHDAPLTIGDKTFQAFVAADQGYMLETGPDGEKRYPIVQVMGGKNVYFFLTPMEGGRLQTMPLSYRVGTAEWYDTTASMTRHFTHDLEDQAVEWTDSLLTFNTACHACHVSQLKNNYDEETDTYFTEWKEPGINCESCHGPGEEHNRVCREAAERGEVPEDLKLILWGDLSSEQRNASCSSCHAKAGPITDSFVTGDRFFDHYDLQALENVDYYPDGRDLGENYTYTSWSMSPCVQAGNFDCVHCHTSSGRYRFAAEEKANHSCLPCHQKKVDNVTKHSRHGSKDKPAHCISCHMPMTSFAHMNRSDHSMRPPMPLVSEKFGSPNACLLCHKDKDNAWAQKNVKKWHPDSTMQQQTLVWATLLDEARQGDYTRVAEMVKLVSDEQLDPVVRASLIRLIPDRGQEGRDEAFRIAAITKSELVRSSAVGGLNPLRSSDNLRVLLNACSDDVRLVRVRAAGQMVEFPQERLLPEARTVVEKAEAEMLTAQTQRKDHWGAHYNLGNYNMSKGLLPEAVSAFEKSRSIRPDVLMPLLNGSMAYARLGQMDKAEEWLRDALKLEPSSTAALFNLALLEAEHGKNAEAVKHLEQALEFEPGFAQAAFNLAIMLSATDLERTIRLMETAVAASPQDANYLYTLAYYQQVGGKKKQAVAALQKGVESRVVSASIYDMLIRLLIEQDKMDEARKIQAQAVADPMLSPADRRAFGRQ